MQVCGFRMYEVQKGQKRHLTLLFESANTAEQIYGTALPGVSVNVLGSFLLRP